MRCSRILITLCMFVGIAACVPAVSQADWYTLNEPIQASQLTEMPFGTRSHWLQPWRSELATRPATSLQDAIGINFNVPASEADATARLLHDSGVRRVRLEIAWNGMSYSDPTQLANPAWWTAYFRAFHKYDLRPLILLNSDSGDPCPTKSLSLDLTQPAASGSTQLDLTPASAAQVVPGLTGFNLDGVSAEVLITSVSPDGVATLSQPLYDSLPAGPASASTLRYEPFSDPTLADGSPNPRFEQTMSGWLAYVRAVTSMATSLLGSDDFDVEVWNELTNGSDFLNENNYYHPSPDPQISGVQLWTTVENALLTDTADWIHDPTNGLPDVKVGDGFANQVPWVSGATVPAGTDAIDHHPYSTGLTFPGSNPNAGVKPLDALGNPAYTQPSPSVYQDIFTPSYRVFMPEYFLNGFQTETLMRDLSPTQTSIYGVPHGANTHPAGSPPPANWITEDNLDAATAEANGLPANDLQEFYAKSALRFYTAYASMGVQAIDLFAAAGPACCQLIPQAFFDAVSANPSTYPHSLGGQVMQAVGRMTSTLAGAQPITNPRQLTLQSIASDNNTDAQFTGNGTAAFPTLYNRDVLAYFPFQLSQNKFVASVYVMTRDLTHNYTSSPAPGSTPYDLPPENFQLTIGNVNGATAAVSLTDPLTGTDQPATVVARQSNQITVQLQATDSPRMLTIDDTPSSGAVVTPPFATPSSQANGSTVVDAPISGRPTPTTTKPTATATAKRTPARAAPAVNLTTPGWVLGQVARRRGISVTLRSAKRCVVVLTASPARSSQKRTSVFARVVIQLASARPVATRMTLTPRGRSWVSGTGNKRLLIAASAGPGVKASKVIKVLGH